MYATENNTSPIGPISVESANSDGQTTFGWKNPPLHLKIWFSTRGDTRYLRKIYKVLLPQG